VKTTSINIQISEAPDRLVRGQAVRRRVSIPHTDLWTQEWWDAQANPSASVRRLIHEETRAHGVGDTLDRLAAPAQRARLVVPFVAAGGPAAHLASPFTAPTPAAPAAPAPAPAAAPATAPGDPRDAAIAALTDQVAAVVAMLADLVPMLSDSVTEPVA
jgi:hypothetical protein